LGHQRVEHEKRIYLRVIGSLNMAADGSKQVACVSDQGWQTRVVWKFAGIDPISIEGLISEKMLVDLTP
jgi:hypothetical protein